MKLVALSGSVRSESYNLALLRAMKQLCPKASSVIIYDQIKAIPIFDPSLSDDELPANVMSLISILRESEGVIISTPEYAYGVPGVLKNTLDWLVSSDVLILKPIVVTSVSTSGLGGVRSHSALITILTAMNTNVIVEGSMNVPSAQRKFDDALNLIDDLTINAITIMFKAMGNAIEDA